MLAAPGANQQAARAAVVPPRPVHDAEHARTHAAHVAEVVRRQHRRQLLVRRLQYDNERAVVVAERRPRGALQLPQHGANVQRPLQLRLARRRAHPERLVLAVPFWQLLLLVGVPIFSLLLLLLLLLLVVVVVVVVFCCCYYRG